MNKSNCRFQELCNCYNPNSETCKNDGGIGSDFKAHCGKHKELFQISKKKRRKIPIEVKISLLEVVKS